MINSQESEDRSKKNDYRTIEQTMEKFSGGTRRLAAQLTTSASFDSLWSVLTCLLYTSPSPRDATLSRMPSSA